MGNFAYTLFSVLLGWVQQAVAWLWSLAGTDGATGLMGWVMENWLALAIALCLAGAAVDFVVYLIRWQPYRVWRGRSRRDEGNEDGLEPQIPGEPPMQWVYATGEAVPQPDPVRETQEPAPQPEWSERPHRRVFAARDHRTDAAHEGSGYVQQGYRQAYFPPQWTGGDGDSTDGGMYK